VFTIITNVCSTDGARIRKTLPHWLRVFGSKIDEILVVVDRVRPTGRIADLHSYADSDLESIDDELVKLRALDGRVTICDLDYKKLEDVSKIWFKSGRPIRCQAGTPIFAFTYALSLAKAQCVLKLDCDMLFYDNGFSGQAISMIESNEYDFVEPPRLFLGADSDFSTRAYFVNCEGLIRQLPIVAHKLDFVRRIHRRFKGKPPYLALEKMLQKEILAKTLSGAILPGDLGFSMHVPRAEQFRERTIDSVIQLVEAGSVSLVQEKESWDYSEELWKP
jgi:hypothetical protein